MSSFNFNLLFCIQLSLMMDNNTSSEVKEEFSPFDGFRESLEYANIRISELESENSRIPELEAKIRELEDQLN